MQWISKKPAVEIFFLYTVSICVLILFFFQPNSGLAGIVFISALVLDSGHGYITLFRVCTHSDKVKRRIYLLLLAVIFLVTLSLFYLQAPKLWTLLIYFTFFHHLRQNIGITKLYGRVGRMNWPVEEWCAKALIVGAFLILHLRSDLKLGIYTANDFLFYPQKNVAEILIMVFSVFLLIYLGSLIWRAAKSPLAIPYVLSLGIPTAFNVICFLFGDSLVQIIGPLLVYHALIYIWLTSEFMKTKKLFRLNEIVIFIVVTFATIFFGGLESYITSDIENFDYFLSNNTNLFIITLVTMPALWHYIVDGFIWKKKDSDFIDYINHIESKV